MVKLRSASSTVVHTRLVHLKGRLIGFDGNGDGLLGDGGDQRFLVHLGDIGVAGDGHNVLALFVAGTVGGVVRIVLFGADTAILDDKTEGVIHKTASAAIVATGTVAVDQILFSQGDQFSGVDEDVPFSGTGGGEGPARTALALVLNGGDGTLLAPVYTGRGFLCFGSQGVVVVFGLVQVLVRISPASHFLGELRVGHVGELVVANGVAETLLVFRDDKVVPLSEGLHGLGFFFKSGILLVEMLFPRGPLGLRVELFRVEVDGDGGQQGQLAGVGGRDGGNRRHDHSGEFHDEECKRT